MPCFPDDVAARAMGDAGFGVRSGGALESHQFQLFLQPQVELPSRLVGGRGPAALAAGQCHHLSAAEHPLAVLERISDGQAVPLGDQQAAQHLAALDAAGCVGVSVNLVADDLRIRSCPVHPADVRNLADSTRACAFELTERAGLQGRDVRTRNLEPSRGRGRAPGPG